MKPAQYKAAREALGWTHAKLAETIGVSERTPFRYAAGEVEVPEPAARLLRLLVLLRLTVSARKFDELVAELRHEWKRQNPQHPPSTRARHHRGGPSARYPRVHRPA
jgi:transcriptional regulator with XRE-family HTH domain